MPLNSATWDPVRQKIYACRGGYVFKFDANGVLEDSARFVAPEMDDTYLAYDSTTDHVWVTHYRAFGSPTDGATGSGLHYLAKIHPDTLAVTLYNFDTDLTFGPSIIGPCEGPRQIVIESGIAFILAVVSNEYQFIYRVDLSSLTVTHNFPTVPGGGWGNMLIDGADLWFCSNDGFNDISARLVTNLAAGPDIMQLNGTTDRPYGITRNPGSDMYAVQATQFVLKGAVGPAPALRSVIDLGRTDATPVNIRYNNVDFLIYIPCWKDNTVVVLDPVDDSFVVKTGFDSPVDMVFTGSKVFAVQHGSEGLKEVT